MTDRTLACLILAAGKGTRMKSDLPKVLHKIAGAPLLRHVLDAAEPLRPDRMVVVVGPGMAAVEAAASPWPTVVQPNQLGTGDAVRAGLAGLEGDVDDVLVIYGDTPLVTAQTLAAMVERRRSEDDPAIVVLGMRPEDPAAYGRLLTDPAGRLKAIVEAADAGPEERAIGLCNGGLMAFDGRLLPGLLAAIGNDNAKGEYYLTDTIAAARAAGRICAVVEGAHEEVQGVNSRAELAEADRAVQQRLRARAMADGVTFLDPSSVYLCADTVLGRDVVIEPSVVFGPGVRVGDDVEIRAFCHLEGVTIGSGVGVGPFARLRPGAEIGDDCHIGNFVEVKNAVLGAGAKANHLTYIGDADVGARTNIGAGTITCNYDGFFKHRTVIGEEAFIGSNTALVPPVRIGDRANVGAGSVITRDVSDDALAVERSRQVEIAGAAKRQRARKAAEKAAKAAKTTAK